MKLKKYITKKILNELVKSNLIDKNELCIYEYGIDLLLKYIINIFTIVLIGFSQSKFIELIFFMGVFVFIRCYSGGIHFYNAKFCYIFTIIYIYLFFFFFDISISINSMNILFYLCSFILYILSPVDNKKRKFDSIEKKYFSKKSKRNIFLLQLIYIFCLQKNFYKFIHIICISCVFSTLTIIFSIIIKRYNTKFFL